MATTLGITELASNVLVSGFSTWKIKAGTGGGETADDAYYSLGNLADGRIIQRALVQPTDRGYAKPYAVEFEASAKMLGTDKTACLSLLSSISYVHCTHKITAINGKTFIGSWGTLKWRFDSSRDYDGYRYIDVSAKRRVLLTHATETDWADFRSAAPADGTPDVGDILYAFAPATTYPAGISAMTFDPAGDAETIGAFRNGKFVAESLCTEDHYGRYLGYGIKVDVEAEMLQTDEELDYLDDSFSGADSFVITLADGTIVTLSSKSGISWEYHLEGAADTPGYIRIIGGGFVKLNEWSGLLS